MTRYTPPQVPYLTLRRLSDTTGIPYSTLNEHVRLHKLKARNIGQGSERARWLIHIDDFLSWVEQHPDNQGGAP